VDLSTDGGRARELVLGDYVLRLDGTVVEVLHSSGGCDRFHVTHVAVEAKEARDGGLKLRVGVETGGTIVGGAKLEVPPEQRGEAEALFDEAQARRGP
jgi:hypothetical protein